MIDPEALLGLATDCIVEMSMRGVIANLDEAGYARLLGAVFQTVCNGYFRSITPYYEYGAKIVYGIAREAAQELQKRGLLSLADGSVDRARHWLYKTTEKAWMLARADKAQGG
jgi:hypothetical protein